jgi:hypothetical protein
MAWSDTGDFTSGQILTAAAMDKVREAMFFGQATFANEAARDTAFANPGALAPITLQEGMRAYLTAPTVPAATGATTSVPSGITTIYNGSVWVCTTAVATLNNASGTVTANTFTPTLAGSPGTNLSVTLVTGTTALVSIQATLANNTDGQGAYIGLAVSGATTLAANNDNSLYNGGPASRYIQAAATFVLTGLTAGTNTFTFNYRVGNTGTAEFLQRRLTVQGIA